jgi:hypothetical protein
MNLYEEKLRYVHYVLRSLDRSLFGLLYCSVYDAPSNAIICPLANQVAMPAVLATRCYDSATTTAQQACDDYCNKFDELGNAHCTSIVVSNVTNAAAGECSTSGPAGTDPTAHATCSRGGRICQTQVSSPVGVYCSSLVAVSSVVADTCFDAATNTAENACENAFLDPTSGRTPSSTA